MSKDPVCGMTVDDKAPYSSIHAGQTFRFCSAGCKAKFDQEPARYATASAGEKRPAT
ncbi:MAG: YHS domain-containing protein [Acidobacteriota bacterium]